MTATHDVHPTIPTTPVLYLALELGQRAWKLALLQVRLSPSSLTPLPLIKEAFGYEPVQDLAVPGGAGGQFKQWSHGSCLIRIAGGKYRYPAGRP